MENINNIELYAKILVGITGAFATFGRIRDSFSSIKRKQEIKLDLEILDKLKSTNNIQIGNIEEKINANLKRAFENRPESLTSFIVGITTFIGFGFWTIDIINQSDSFNGWIILTLFLSLVGLSMIFDSKNKDIDKGIFYQIGFYDKSNFKFGVILTLFTGILTPVLIWKLNGFSFWQFLSGLFFLIGIVSLVRNIKKIE